MMYQAMTMALIQHHLPTATGLQGRTLEIISTLQISARKRDRLQTPGISQQKTPKIWLNDAEPRSNEYGSRAWTTRDVFLAKSIHILAGDTETRLDELGYVARTFPSMTQVMNSCLQTTLKTPQNSKADVDEAIAAYQQSCVKSGLGLPHLLIKGYRANPRQIESVLELGEEGAGWGKAQDESEGNCRCVCVRTLGRWKALRSEKEQSMSWNATASTAQSVFGSVLNELNMLFPYLVSVFHIAVAAFSPMGGIEHPLI